MARGKAWRRSMDATKERKQLHVDQLRAQRRPGADSFKPSPAVKSWKNMYTRSKKVARGRQLGFDYPRKTQHEILAEHTESDS